MKYVDILDFKTRSLVRIHDFGFYHVVNYANNRKPFHTFLGSNELRIYLSMFCRMFLPFSINFLHVILKRRSSVELFEILSQFVVERNHSVSLGVNDSLIVVTHDSATNVCTFELCHRDYCYYYKSPESLRLNR